jgi:hypothetical protein
MVQHIAPVTHHSPPLRHLVERGRVRVMELVMLGVAVALAVTIVVSLAFEIGHH